MEKTFCDRCGKPVQTTDGKVEFWDKSFREDLSGVIWFVGVHGNYMNSKVDVCRDCSLEGLKLLSTRRT